MENGRFVCRKIVTFTGTLAVTAISASNVISSTIWWCAGCGSKLISATISASIESCCISISASCEGHFRGKGRGRDMLEYILMCI